MGMRITTNMMMNSYRYNLQLSTGVLDDSRNKLLTQRKFNSYAEDPASATHSWRVRRALTRNAGYQTNNTNAYTRLNSAWATMKSMDDPSDGLLNGDGGAFAAIKRADNDPTGGARTALGKVLSNLADSVVFSMNGAKYGDHFLFAGNDEMNAPFSWDGDKLLYRGVNVNAGMVKSPDKAPDWGQMIPKDTPELEKGATDLEEAWIEYYRKDAPNPLNHRPDWVSEYEQYQKDLKAFQADPEHVKAPDVPDLPKEMTALDDAWLTYLNTPDPDRADFADDAAYEDAVKAKEALNPMNVDNKPAWSEGDGEVPANMPKINTRSSEWERAWVAYYENQAKDPNDPDSGFDPNIKDPTTTKVTDYDWYKTYQETGELPKDADIPAEDHLQRAWLEYAYDQRDLAKLDEMSKEVKNVDLGMGFQEETGDRDLIQSTAFNRALPGINMIGYGVDEDGDPRNIATIMKRLAELYSHCDEEGEFASEAEEKEVYRLLGKFGEAHNRFNEAYSEVDTKSEFLVANGARLKDQGYTLKEQIADLEQVDMADAINDFSWAYYCFSSALKIGNQLLSQSLIDYMR